MNSIGRPAATMTFPTAEERRLDPYPYYDLLRAQDQPLVFSPEFGNWHTASYAQVKALLVHPDLSTDPSFAAEPRRGGSEAGENLARQRETRVLLFLDPPDHTRIRRLASKRFTQRAVAPLTPAITAIANSLLDEMGVAPGSGEFDLVAGYARILPLAVICHLFAIPEIDRINFLRWSDDLAHALEPMETAEDMERTINSYLEFNAYFSRLATERRLDLGDDLLSTLLAAEEAGDRLDIAELEALFTLLFIAGHETTGNLIGNGTLALLRNPDQLALLRADPDLFPGAVDELLRYDSSVQLTARIARKAVPVPGTNVIIEAGQEVVCYLAGANHDPDEFGPTAARLDVTRDARNHVSFGGGIHYCMGASLARLEAEVALRTLLDRCPDLELVDEHPVHRDQVVLRGLERLDLASR